MKKSKGVVYCVTNTRNGKKYVGITLRTAKKRWARHVRDALERRSKFPLHRAIRKHGPDAFTVEIIARGDDWRELCQLEQHYIAKLKTHWRQGGYNCTAGGEGVVDLPEESRARIGAVVKRLHADPEFAARRDARLKRLNADPEFRAKQAAAVSKAAKRLWTDDGFRTKQAAAASKTAKRLNADPKFAARRDARLKRLWTDKEFRAKMSEVSRRAGQMTIQRLRAEGWRGERTAFTEFCREHGLDGRNVRYHLRKRGIYGLKDINDPRVREVLDEMIAELAHEKATSIMTLH